MIVLPPQLYSLVHDRVHRFVSLWRITRTDGLVLRFTNHDSAISYANHIYEPSGSPSATAKQKLDGLRDRNLEFQGAITSDAIKYEDLLAGRFRKAKVEELLVDWRYPWADPFATYQYYIVSTTYTGEFWMAQVEGMTHRLKQAVGRVYSRLCDVRNFGDHRCAVLGGEAAYTVSTVVTEIHNPRKEFFSTDLAFYPDNWFKRGYVRFSSGLNDGLTMEVNRHITGSGRIRLWINLPYNIAIGDTFNIVAGCNRLLKTCLNKFNNVPNFRGFPFIPGTDAMLRTPNAHN
jgi:uncharacterized phage protein (TIGR02218 family)